MHEDDNNDELTFGRLHWMTSALFLAAGAETAFGERRGDYRPPDAVRWAPLVAAPLACAAHAAQAIAPGTHTRRIAQIMNAVAVGVGAAGMASSVYSTIQDRHEDDTRSLIGALPSMSPLAFAAVGVLGFLLDGEERDEAEDRRQLRAHLQSLGTAKRKRKRVKRIVVRT
jgi:hypothetical protein